MFRFRSCTAALFVITIAGLTGGCSTSSPPVSVNISPSAAAIDQGQTVKLTASVTNGSYQGVTWSITGPGSLGNGSAYSVTYNSPQTNLSTAQHATITATSLADNTKSASVQVTVNPYPLFPVQTLARGSVGTLYSEPIALIGGTPPFQWSLYDGSVITGWKIDGSVPNGLALDPSTGTISGTPTDAGTWYFEAVVTDSAGVTVDDGFLSIQIDPKGPYGNPVPFLNQPFAPSVASPGSAGLTLGVSGTGFVSGATVDLNGTPLTTTFVDSEHLTAAVPAIDLVKPATASITVVNPAPGGGRSNNVYFQIGAPEATVSFSNAPNSPLQIPEVIALTTGDFNEDGKPDLAIAGNVRVYVLLGKGDGTFTPAPGDPVKVPSPPYDNFASPDVGPLVAADFNHSGHLGITVALTQNEAVATVFGNGDGTFTYSNTLSYTKGEPTNSIAVGDFNGDGNLDFVAINLFTGLSPVPMLGFSNGAFNQVVENVQIPGGSAVAADFNGDGRLDLAIDGSRILLGSGDGSFASGPVAPDSGIAAAADFNGDGKIDLALAQSGTNTFTLLLGNGDGTFSIAPGSPVPIGSEPEAIVAGDFNNDGKLDLAIANYSDGTVTLLLGNGDGTFAPAAGSPYPVGQGPCAIAIADFNGDGKLDLAVANLDPGTVSIFLQQ